MFATTDRTGTSASINAGRSPLAIQVSMVTRRFGSFTALDRVSLEVPRGSIFALLGPNGAGKSTLIKILTTLLRPSSGCIHIDGIDVVRHASEARKRFGVVFQSSSLDDEMTPLEHLEIHAAFFRVPVEHAKSLGQQLLLDFDLWDKRNERIKNFSGGQKRRLEIARVFIHEPRLLVLDEPTVGLDAQSRRQLWTYIHAVKARQQLTVLLATHYLEEAEQMATHVAVLSSGSIVAEGTPLSIMEEAAERSLEEAFLTLIDGLQAGANADHAKAGKAAKHG